MKKSIFLFFAAILCASSVWAADMSSAEIYYDNTASQWSDVQLFVGKSDWNSINPMKKISNTNNLYCLYNFSWGGYSAFYFTTGTASWDPLANNENVDSRSNWATCRSAKQTTSLGSTVNLYISTAATKGASVTRKTLTDYKSLNYKQTVQQQLTSDGTSYSASTEAIATVKVSSYKLGSATTTSATANDGTISSGTSSANCEAARTATVTYSVSGINSSYSFVGWYDGDTQKSTSATYTYQATEAKTITARFAVATEEEHEVTVTYVCGSNTVSAATSAYVGVETEKSFTAPTNITGYKFTEWTIGAGMTLKTGAATDATIGVVTKSASSGYTLVANYEEVMETVYFINTGKWSVVNLHRWGGTAAGTSWPGEAMTKTGEKIGEYDVYSFTAQQGAFANVIFTNKDTGSDQTADLTWTAGKYYIYNYGGKSDWYTKEDAEALLVTPVVKTYTVVGSSAPLFGEAWATAKTENDMTLVEGTKYELVKSDIALTAGDILYKVAVDHAWTESYPTNNQTLNIPEDGKYTVTFTFDSNTKAVGATAKLEEAVVVLPTIKVKGAWDGWTANTTLTGDNTSASATINIATAGVYEFGLDVDGDFQASGATIDKTNNSTVVTKNDGNMKLKANVLGDYTFTWTYETKTLVVTYPAGEEVEIAKKYYIAGTLAGGWSATQQGMTKEGDLYKHTFSALAAGTYEFKITDGQFNSEGDNTHEHTTLGAAYEEVSYNEGNIKIVTEEAINLTVIFDAATDKITFEGLTPVTATLTYKVKVPAGTDECYIAGPCNSWDFRKMTREGTTDVFTIEIVGAKETDEYKYACKANWDYAEVREADENGNSNRKAWTALDEVTAWNKPVVYTYYLMGVNDDWATGIEMEVNTDAENEVMLTCQPVNGEVKIKRLDDDGNEYWYGGNSLKAEEGNLGTNTSTDGGDGNIKLLAGIYNFYFNTNDGKLWIAAATGCVLELGDGDNSSVLVNGVTVDLKVTRSFASGTLYTLALPFAMDNNTVKNIFGTDVELYDFTSLSENASGELILSFTKQATPAIAAGTPYLIKPKTNANGFDLLGVKLNTATKPVEKECGPTTITMQPVLSATAEAKTNGASQYWLAADNNLHNNVVSIKGLRAIFDVQTTKANVRARAAFNENEATGVEDLFTTDAPVKVIENGQLIIIRDGVKYNVQGQKL